MKVNSPEDAELIVQKLPCDLGIHRNPRKGTLNAPDKLTADLDTGREILVDEVFPDEFNLEETHRRIEENTETLANYRTPLISVGGDHSVSFPTVKSLKQENPDLKLVWLDAHLDLKQKVDGHVSHDVVVRELLENGFSEDEIVFVGITRIDEDEQKFLDEHDLRVYMSDELDEFLREFTFSEQPCYLSIDIDVLDQSLAPGTGYPDGELTTGQVRQVIERVQPVHGDLVEVAPCLDEKGKTVGNGREVLQNLIEIV
ncbi:arginase family protein [Candidatus Nanohalococcus occultus]|uniref:arginase family protein n=1 Tax=Candidatus Nanohalococcus occultus TaxID=2978047 RepID=UPI0039DFB0CF